jgi:hypothetical protein
MIVCGGCGSENELGRVFCTQCGGKLDLSGMTSEVIAEQAKRSFMAKHWLKFVIGVAVIILLIFGMTFWSTGPLQSKVGTSVGARRVQSQMRSMAKLSRGRTVAYIFKEADINGFFKYGKGKDMELGEVTVRCTPDVLRIHVSDKMFTQKIGGIVLSPGTTYDLAGITIGSNLIIGQAKKGHLGLIGPCKNGVVKKFYKKIAAKNGFDAFKYATAIKIEEGQIRVTVSNK